MGYGRDLIGGCGLLSVQDIAGLMIELEEVAEQDSRMLLCKETG